MLKKLLAAAVLSVLAVAPLAAEVVKGEWTGYITDTHCGKRGANKDHTGACVEKCMKGGSKAQLFSESDSKTYELDSFDKVKPLVGKQVTVKGSLDTAKNIIAVETAAVAAK